MGKKKRTKAKKPTEIHHPPVKIEEYDDDGEPIIPEGFVECYHRRGGRMMQKLATVETVPTEET